MNLRVTGQTQINNALANLRRQQADAAVFQNQLSSGLKVKAASDNPAAFAAIAQARTLSKRSANYQETITDATTDLNSGVSVLLETNKLLGRARQLAQEGANSATDKQAYEGLATEVDSLISQAIDLSNRQSDGHYLFGGTADNAPPFRVATTTTDGKPATIAYDGAAEAAAGRIGPTQTVNSKYAGGGVFQTAGADVFASLIGLRDDLRNTTLSSNAKAAAVSARIGNLQSASDHVGGVIAEQSASLSGMEAIQSRLTDLKLNADSRAGDLEATDYAEAVLGLKQQEAAFQATLGVTAKLLSPSLLDFIR